MLQRIQHELARLVGAFHESCEKRSVRMAQIDGWKEFLLKHDARDGGET